MFKRHRFLLGAAAVIAASVTSTHPAHAQIVISDDFESYATETPNIPATPYDFNAGGVPSNISAQVLDTGGVAGSNGFELQFDTTTGQVLNTGVRWQLPTANNLSSNLANYTLTLDMKLASGVTTGFNSNFEIFDNVGGTLGFTLDMSDMVAGGPFKSFSFSLASPTYTIGTAFNPLVANWDVQAFALGYIAQVTQVDQTLIYDNIQVAVPPIPAVPLTLIVDKNTEQVVIRNNSANPVSFDYYRIESAMSALDPSGWTSLDDQNIDAFLPADFNNSGGAVDAGDLATWRGAYGPGNAGGDADNDGDSDGDDFLAWQQSLGQSAGPSDGWLEGGASDPSVIGELFLNGATTLAPGTQVSLGAAYNKAIFGASNADLVFRVSTGESSALGMGTVTYVPAGNPVPEPSSALLCLVGVSVLAWKRRQ